MTTVEQRVVYMVRAAHLVYVDDDATIGTDVLVSKEWPNNL